MSKVDRECLVSSQLLWVIRKIKVKFSTVLPFPATDSDVSEDEHWVYEIVTFLSPCFQNTKIMIYRLKNVAHIFSNSNGDVWHSVGCLVLFSEWWDLRGCLWNCVPLIGYELNVCVYVYVWQAKSRWVTLTPQCRVYLCGWQTVMFLAHWVRSFFLHTWLIQGAVGCHSILTAVLHGAGTREGVSSVV